MRLRKRMSVAPAAPIALLEVLPGRTAFHGEHAGLDALNRELASLASERGLAFVRTRRPPLVDGNGDLVTEMSVDSHHLNGAGYGVLANWIRDDGGAAAAALR